MATRRAFVIHLQGVDRDKERATEGVVVGHARWEACKATTLAARTRADIEVAKLQGKHTYMVGTARSVTRAGHKLAGDLAITTGLQPTVANMDLDMDHGDGRATTHGAVAQPHDGLVAGGALVRGSLKTFMDTVKTECPEGRPRGFSDHTTLGAEGDTAIDCAARMPASWKSSRALCAGIMWRSTTGNKSWGRAKK